MQPLEFRFEGHFHRDRATRAGVWRYAARGEGPMSKNGARIFWGLAGVPGPRRWSRIEGPFAAYVRGFLVPGGPRRSPQVTELWLSPVYRYIRSRSQPVGAVCRRRRSPQTRSPRSPSAQPADVDILYRLQPAIIRAGIQLPNPSPLSARATAAVARSRYRRQTFAAVPLRSRQTEVCRRSRRYFTSQTTSWA